MGRLICPFNAKIGWTTTFLCHVELIQNWQISQLTVDSSWTYISSPTLVCCTIGLGADLVQVLLKNQTNCVLFMHLCIRVDTYISLGWGETQTGLFLERYSIIVFVVEVSWALFWRKWVLEFHSVLDSGPPCWSLTLWSRFLNRLL